MIAENCMRSLKCKKLTSFLLLMSLHFMVPGQNTDEIAFFKSAYPGHSVITEVTEKKVFIEYQPTKGIKIQEKDFDSKIILNENATVYSNGREYFNPRVNLVSFKAYTVVPGVKKSQKIDVKNFIKETEIDDGLFYDDTYCYSFNFPSVTLGSKITTESETVHYDPYFPVIYSFGNTIPIHNARLELTVPNTVIIKYQLFGSDTNKIKFTLTNTGKYKTYKWEANQMPAYTEDEFSPDYRYFTPHIIIHISELDGKPIMGNLNDLFSWHSNNTKKLSQSIHPDIKNYTDSLLNNTIEPEQKASTLFKWVQQNIRYIAIEDGDNGFVPREAITVFRNRYGDCKDKSNLLKAMLQSAGLESGLAWVGTRNLPYSYSKFQSMANDDHLICIWWEYPDKPVFLDATTLSHTLRQVPAFIQGKECMAELPGGGFRILDIPVADANLNLVADTTWLEFSNGKLSGKLNMYFEGEMRANLMSRLKYIEPSKLNNLIPEIKSFASNKFVANNTSYIYPPDDNVPLFMQCGINMDGYSTQNGNSLYVNLHTERLFLEYNQNLKRSIPIINHYCINSQNTTILRIPEGMVVKSLPDNSSYNSGVFGFSTEYTQKENLVILNFKLRVNTLLIDGELLQQFNEMISNLKKVYLNSVVLNKI